MDGELTRSGLPEALAAFGAARSAREPDILELAVVQGREVSPRAVAMVPEREGQEDAAAQPPRAGLATDGASVKDNLHGRTMLPARRSALRPIPKYLLAWDRKTTGDTMRVLTTLAAIGLCLAATACNDPGRSVAKKEDMMAAAGFKVLPVNTPERQAAFRTLPPHTFVRQGKDNKVVYVYADPTICNCLYVGGQKAFGTYNTLRLEKRMANIQLQAAVDNSMDSWNWGPWGAGYPMGWPYYLE